MVGAPPVPSFPVWRGFEVVSSLGQRARSHRLVEAFAWEALSPLLVFGSDAPMLHRKQEGVEAPVKATAPTTATTFLS